MVQSATDKKTALIEPTAAPRTQARLILQDPIAFDQSSQPALRSSLELVPDAAPTMEREKARELWENLNDEPEVALEKQNERKRLLARSEALAKEAAASKADVAALKAQIAKQEHDRFNHPLIYAGGAAIVGLGALFWLERRKRLQAEDQAIDELASRSTTDFDAIPLAQVKRAAQKSAPSDVADFDYSEELAQEFATDLPGLPSKSGAVQVDNTRDNSVVLEDAVFAPPELQDKGAKHPVASDLPPVAKPVDAQTPPWAQPQSGKRQVPLPADLEVAVLSTQAKEKHSLLSRSKRMFDNMLGRKNPQEYGHSSHLPTETLNIHAAGSTGNSTLIAQDFDEGSQWGIDHEAQMAFEQELRAQQMRPADDLPDDQGAYDPDQANIELLSQTRANPISGEHAMEHLLELRTAVNGLCVLGRPEGASRLLLEHIETNPDTCAWAYLEYMQICELQNQRDAFETIKTRYRMQFNRMAPYWFEPNSHVLGLDGYARATNELCSAWAKGKAHASQTINAWLIGPMIGRKLVQLPAYYDLFDLYEMLEFVADEQASSHAELLGLPMLSNVVSTSQASKKTGPDDDFVATVSLLDLDYEFSSDVTLEAKEVQQSEKSVTVVKTGNFSVDFNVAGTQMGSLNSMPADLPKK